jgi:hypothetical protein
MYAQENDVPLKRKNDHVFSLLRKPLPQASVGAKVRRRSYKQGGGSLFR